MGYKASTEKFGEERRKFLFKRFFKTSLRAIHIIGVVGCGAILLGLPKDVYINYWIIAMTSGCLLTGLEIFSSKYWIIQLKGIFTILKLVLLFCFIPFPEYKAELFIAATLLAVYTAHGPSEFRHYSLWHKKQISTKEIKG